MSEREVRFGVNYVPSKNWHYSWTEWEEDSIREDLQAIGSLGMDHIRIHCLWPVFQPNINLVSRMALDRLHKLLDMADEVGLDVEITVLDGWMSGIAFYPAFCDYSLEGKRNIFTHPAIIQAEKYLLSEIVREIGSHPRFLGFDIGNEINVLSAFGQEVSIPEGNAWLKDILAYCEEIAPGKLHVVGVDHQPWFMDSVFSRDILSTTGSMSSVHAWVAFTGALSRYGPMGSGALHLVEYCIELAKAYGGRGRSIWVQEFGASGQWMPEEVIPEFAEQTILNALSCDNVWGFTWWCSHDLNPSLGDFHPLEQDLGLLDNHNRVKPAGKRIAEIIKSCRACTPEAISRPTALVMPDEIFACPSGKPDTVNSPGWKLAKPYMDLVEQGIRPSIVLESRASDAGYLKSRGIRELKHLGR